MSPLFKHDFHFAYSSRVSREGTLHVIWLKVGVVFLKFLTDLVLICKEGEKAFSCIRCEHTLRFWIV